MRSPQNQTIGTARHIARNATKLIKDKTGMRVNLVLCPSEHPLRTPEQLLNVVAASLHMDPALYRSTCRERSIVEMRFLGAFMLRTYFPAITLHQISVLFGGRDHTTIINALHRAGALIATGDARFTSKYQTVLRSVNTWLRKEVLGYASAISA